MKIFLSLTFIFLALLNLGCGKKSSLEQYPEFNEYKEQIKEGLSVEEILLMLKEQNRWPLHPPIISGSLYLIGDLFQKRILIN